MPPSPARAQLEAYFLSSIRGGLRATLEALSRNVAEAVEGPEAGARAAALARADVKTGAPGDELEDLAAEEAFIAGLVVEDLAAELQEEALHGFH